MTSTRLDTLVLIVVLGAAFVGFTLLLAEVPWFARRPLIERLRPYTRHAGDPASRRATGTTLRQVVAPLVQAAGTRLSNALGVTDDLSVRLERAGSDTDPAEFRLRQLTLALVALAGSAAFVLLVSPPTVMSVALLLGAPALAVLGQEQQLNRRNLERQRRLRAELPVVVEQLGMLLSAGYSVTGALSRLSRRSDGAVATDLRRVLQRVGHGLSDTAALAEWAAISDLDSIRRLVAVLSLHGEAGDLGSLISEEARSVRAEAHRDLLESIERRSQLVWVPVTVATLVPGLIFLAVPFISAMSQVTGS